MRQPTRRRRSNTNESGAENPMIPKDDEVLIRTYGVGLGDCFLLAFAGDPKPCYVMIDCGIAQGTPEDEGRIKRILQDVHAATGGTIDILVVTHEHHDHVSGFVLGEEEWKNLTVLQVWVPWIEGGGQEADDIREVKKKLNLGVVNAMKQFGAWGREVPAELRLEADFLGMDSPGEAFGARESTVVKGYRLAKQLGKELVTCDPGEVRLLPRTKINTYVLGPPRYAFKGKELKKGKRHLIKLLEDESEMYGYRDINLEPEEGSHGAKSLSVNDGDDLLARALTAMEDPNEDRHQPFDNRYRVDWDTAMLDSFFYERYSSVDEWRQINDDWLDSAPDMALRAGGLTNNISLVLAFEMPKSKRILLFPGDAQVGNWLSWHEISEWSAKDGAKIDDPSITAEKLLNQVIFYKVGHHGSHNATIKQKGLEMMGFGNKAPGKSMVAYVPVSTAIAHDVMFYCPMPFYPVMKRLQQVTKGNLYLPVGGRAKPEPEDFQPTPNVTVLESLDRFEPFVKDGKELEPGCPVYTQFAIRDVPEEN